ncbi:MAG: sterol desaturase family protein [bacterium]|nr:sterol desaturase family protein [bacterium]
MDKYWRIIVDSYTGYFGYLVREIGILTWHNYFYALIVISLFFFILEQAFPWRVGQPRIRKDFWLDVFYMFFNFFIFPLLLFNALGNTASQLFGDFLGVFGLTNWVAISVGSLPKWGQLILMMVLRDFIQFNIHRLLHRSNYLWEFHKVHHSVKQMGFAAQLRYHWMENIVYKSLEYIPLGLLGFGIGDFFIIHAIAIFIGHFNHANFKIPLGPFKYIFNNPQMHIWHHAKKMPHRYGCNFGISLSLWDYLFGTAYIPSDGRDIRLGFPGDRKFPKGFVTQSVYPFIKPKKKSDGKNEK